MTNPVRVLADLCQGILRSDVQLHLCSVFWVQTWRKLLWGAWVPDELVFFKTLWE
jgi:hypothetical protein